MKVELPKYLDRDVSPGWTDLARDDVDEVLHDDNASDAAYRLAEFVYGVLLWCDDVEKLED